MKSVFDASFRYKPSFETDVRKTFDRIRREQQARKSAPKHELVAELHEPRRVLELAAFGEHRLVE